MLRRILLCVVTVVGFSVVAARADSKDDVKAAVQKLADSPSYSWKTTTQGRFGGNQSGKTEKDGYTSVTMTMRDNEYDVVMKGDKQVVKTDSGWKTAAEVMAEPADDAGGPPPPDRMAAMLAQNFRSPTTLAQENLDGLQNIQKTDDGYTADLTDDAAKKLMTFRPRRAATTNPDNGNAPPPFEVSNAKGTMKLAIKDGNLTQMQLHLTGTISFNGNDRDIDRTITTDITDVGTTKVDVPDDAKAKLGS